MKTLAKMVSEITKDQIRDMEDRVDEKFSDLGETQSRKSPRMQKI